MPETWFFRDRVAVDFLVTHIRAQESLGRIAPWRILSLGCATGEEAYSVAMALLDAGLAPFRFSVEGIDLSNRAIQKAQLGVYGNNSFRTQTTLLHERHFHQLGNDRFSVDYNVRSRVVFSTGKCFGTRFYRARPKYDVIFCRNMLIYFRPAMQNAVLHICRDPLGMEGIFIVGPTETEMARQVGFEPMGFRMSCAFRLTGRKQHAQPQPPKSTSLIRTK